ncbi:hypothetical protein BTW07_06210 [Salinicola socius]|uniref:Oxidoreductase n=2 Tax=Halomonadaceae TaxID=28256 RepID=A0A1Q8SUU2_9GAMM|nr:hypothetical protein BTW07_06210 [Salinicola socius]
MPRCLTDMRILISGCSSGIGLATTRRLLHQGHELIGISRRPPPIETAGFRWCPADLLDSDDGMAWLVEDLAIEALVHAAGFMHTAYLGALNPAQAQTMWRLHVEAPSRLVDRLMAQRHPLSRIILVGSRTQQGARGKSAYSASKAAQQGLVRSWAMELVGQGVTVNLVAPGPTDTPMLNDPARTGVPPQAPPMGHFIAPDEIAAAIEFLISRDARSITGQTLTVCAGASL